MQKLNRQTTSSENDIHEKIGDLSLILTNLEEREKILNESILKHEGNQEKYIRLQSQIEESNKIITELRGTIIGLGMQISKLNDLKSSSLKDNSLLDTQIIEKTKTISDIQIQKKVLTDLQKKIMDFTKIHAGQKKSAENELEIIKVKIQSIQNDISKALNKK